MKQRVLITDIETSPILAYVWGLKDQNIGLNQIVKDWRVIAWSAKWLGEPKNTLVYKDLRADPWKRDLELITPLVKLLKEADIVVTYNGKRFDVPKVAARAIIQQMAPFAVKKHYDVWELAAKVASFTSTKFEYISQQINTKYKKLRHEKYPGMELWTECLNGNVDAWNEMKKYNMWDTLGTEETALLLKGWAPKAFPDWDDEKCDACHKIKKIKVKCQDCGSWSVK